MNRAQMVAPFAEEELRQFQGRGGKTMTFIEDETVMDRLDAGYGYGNWQIEVHEVLGAPGVVKVRLGVREHGEWLWYEDFGYPNQPDGDVLKEAVSDGIRRCGRYVGIARDLYRKSTYEPGGALGPQPSERNPRPGAPPPAESAPEEHLLGVETAQGTVKLGSAAAYKLEVRETADDGSAFGFRLELSNGRAIPQVMVTGPAATVALAASGGDPMALLDHWVRVKGRLYSVRQQGRRAFNRLKVTEIETREWRYPPASDSPSLTGGTGAEPDAAGGESGSLAPQIPASDAPAAVHSGAAAGALPPRVRPTSEPFDR